MSISTMKPIEEIKEYTDENFDMITLHLTNSIIDETNPIIRKEIFSTSEYEILGVNSDGNFYMSDLQRGVIEYSHSRGKYIRSIRGFSLNFNVVGYSDVVIRD